MGRGQHDVFHPTDGNYRDNYDAIFGGMKKKGNAHRSKKSRTQDKLKDKRENNREDRNKEEKRERKSKKGWGIQ